MPSNFPPSQTPCQVLPHPRPHMNRPASPFMRSSRLFARHTGSSGILYECVCRCMYVRLGICACVTGCEGGRGGKVGWSAVVCLGWGYVGKERPTDTRETRRRREWCKHRNRQASNHSPCPSCNGGPPLLQRQQQPAPDSNPCFSAGRRSVPHRVFHLPDPCFAQSCRWTEPISSFRNVFSSPTP